VAGLASHFNTDFAVFINTSIALLSGTGFAVVSVRMFQTLRLDSAIRRLLNAGRRDIVVRAAGGGVDEGRWTGLMIDRTALLLPRMTSTGNRAPGFLDDAIRDLGVGRSVAELHHHASALGESGRHAVDALLAATRQHYRALIAADAIVPAPELMEKIELALRALEVDDTPRRDRCLQAVIDFDRWISAHANGMP
jgi:uncharacterized membrane protein YccC